MKLYSWNVNGIRAVVRKELFSPFLAEANADIICLQENKAQPEEIQIDAPGYQVYANSAEKKGYSGTAIISKPQPIRTEHNLPADLIAKYELTADAYGDANAEGRILMAEYEQFYLVTVYTPNAKDDLSRVPLRQKHWDPAFLDYCKGLEIGAYGPAKPVVFCGDLNVAHTPNDLARPKPNEGKKGYTAEERAGFQAFVDAGFVDTFRLFHEGNGFYTWWAHFGNARANNVGWRIDYFLVSSSLKNNVVAADIHPATLGSDHCPISLELNLD